MKVHTCLLFSMAWLWPLSIQGNEKMHHYPISWLVVQLLVSQACCQLDNEQVTLMLWLKK